MLRLAEMLSKGNVWYVRYYECSFDEVHFVYLLGDRPPAVIQGHTHLVSIGGRWAWLDFVLAPWRLYRYVRLIRPTVVMTSDIVFGGWSTLLVRRLSRKQIALMPVCIPEQLYDDFGVSLSGLPIAVERLLTRWSFAAASRVVVPRGFGAFVDWLRGDSRSTHKLIVVDTMPDVLPGEGFLRRLQSPSPMPHASDALTLIYVGRLHHEKLISDLIDMMKYLADHGLGRDDIRLRLVGDGPERAVLEASAATLGVADRIEFVGAIPNERLPDWLLSSDVFVSPLTGSALREAAVCGLPIVAYDRDWVKGCLHHGVDALLVPSRDVAALGEAVLRLKQDVALRKALANSARALAARLWMPDGLGDSLRALRREVGDAD